jgi:small subunit ribosomal protein S16
MSVKIRLRRTGKINQPAHRIVVTDIRSPRDGSFIECIGFYDPRHETETVDVARVDYWLSKGAKTSETVAAIVKRAREGKTLGAQK